MSDLMGLKWRMIMVNSAFDLKTSEIRTAFKQYVLESFHPCVMAQGMFKQNKVDFHVYFEFGSKKTAKDILGDVKKYLRTYDFTARNFKTFMAVFDDAGVTSEKIFEEKLWQQLQHIHELDDEPWDPTVSHDPEHKNFSFSIGGKAFYVVGLNPYSSRKARQSPYPAMTLNLHYQFEKMRELGIFTNVRDKIRQRDISLQGDINPMLKDFGEESEALQYSGRHLDEQWKCPFKYLKNK